MKKTDCIFLYAKLQERILQRLKRALLRKGRGGM